MRGSMALVGLAMLLPWNSFVNVVGLLEAAFTGTRWASTYAGAFSTTYLVCNFACLAVERARERGGAALGDPSRAVVGGGLLTASVTAVLGVVVGAAYERPAALYDLVVLCMLALGAFTAWLQSGAFRFSAKRDDTGKFTQAIMAGQAAAGVLSSVVIFLLVPGGFRPARAALVYLLITGAIVAASAMRFSCMAKRASRYGQLPHQEASGRPIAREDPEALPGLATVEIELALTQGEPDTAAPRGPDADNLIADEDASPAEEIKAIPPWRHGSLCAVAVFSCFACSLGIFPGVTVHLRPASISNEYFQPLLVLVFNLGDLAGRLAGPGRCLGRPLVQCFYGALRFALVPVILSCGMDATSRVPQAFFGDGWPIFWVSLLGLTNGHLANVSMMVGCKIYSPVAMSLWLNAGLAAGSLLSTAIAAAVFLPASAP